MINGYLRVKVTEWSKKKKKKKRKTTAETVKEIKCFPEKTGQCGHFCLYQ